MLKSPIKFSLVLKKTVNQNRGTFFHKKRSRTEQLKESYASDSNFYKTDFMRTTKQS